MLLEEIGQLSSDSLMAILKALDNELEAPTTTQSFKAWITHRSDGGKGNCFSPLEFSPNLSSSSVLSAYYETCWKVYYSHPKNV